MNTDDLQKGLLGNDGGLGLTPSGSVEHIGTSGKPIRALNAVGARRSRLSYNSKVFLDVLNNQVPPRCHRGIRLGQ